MCGTIPPEEIALYSIVGVIVIFALLAVYVVIKAMND